MRFGCAGEMSELLSNWLQYHFFPTLLVTCIGLAIVVGLIDVRLIPKSPAPIKTGAGVGFRAPSMRNAIFLTLGLGVYFWLMLAWEDFTFYDAHIFFQSLAGGPQYAPLQLFPSLGLLRPLSHQEFYPISFLGNSAQAYQAFAAIEVFLGGYFLTRVYRAHSAITAAICIAILLTPHIVAAVFHLVDSERNILFLLCVFLWAALGYEQSRLTRYLVAASLASFLILQYKETAVVLMMAWAGYLFLASWFMTQLARETRRSLMVLALSVATGCLIWLAVYCIAILPQIGRSYLVGRQHDPIDVLHVVVTHVWFSVLVLAILCRRLMARRDIQVSPVWDGMAVAAVATTAAYIKLGFVHDYYYSPAALLSWLYAGRIAELAYSSAKGNRTFALISLVAAIAGMTAFQLGTTFWWVYSPWKENVASKADAARFIDDFHANRPIEQRRRPLRIVFPESSNYEAAFFVGYLQAKYRILDIEAAIGVLGEDRLEPETSQCVLWVPVMCTYGLPARRGDLVAYFGEEGESLEALKKEYRLVHVSPEIGFWPNALRAYIFTVR